MASFAKDAADGRSSDYTDAAFDESAIDHERQQEMSSAPAPASGKTKPTLARRVVLGFVSHPQHPDPSQRSRKDTLTVLGLRLLLLLLVLTAILVPAIVVPTLKNKGADADAYVGNATYTGSCKNGVCSWTGVRYAAPPTGQLRFAPPKPLPAQSGRISAKRSGTICPQDKSPNQQNEDCLNLDIFRPASAESDTRLPVLIFTHGGGFFSGSAQSINPRPMVLAGDKGELPTVVVSINYRLGLLGLLASSEMAQRQAKNSSDVSLNNALRDMTQAVLWVKQNIASFGGDPNRITIWGQSAGSFGTAAQLMRFANETPPFQAAILQSGSISGLPIDAPVLCDERFERVLLATQCAGALDHIQCLRNMDWKTLNRISLAEQDRSKNMLTIPRGFQAWIPVLDGGPASGGYYTSKPSDAIAANAYAPVPLLHGDCLDEGTSFVTHGSNNDSATAAYISRLYFSGPEAPEQVQSIMQAYPDDPAVGSPYAPVGVAPTQRFFGPTNQYKRLASFYGDIRFQANRRLLLNSATERGIPAYSYVYSQRNSRTPPSLGAPHSIDLDTVTAAPRKPFKNTLALQWLAFAAHHNPNKAREVPDWPQYTNASKVLLSYANDKIDTVQDNFREASINLLNSPAMLEATSR